MLLDLGPHLQALGAGRDHEGRVPAGLELGVDLGDDDVHVGDPAVRGPRLLAVEGPLIRRLVVLGARAQRGDIGAGVGLGYAEGGDLRLGLGAEALRDPFAPLLGRTVGLDRGDAERRAHDRHADPRVAPEELLVDDREHDPALVIPELRDPLQAVETDLRGLLDDRPGRLLALVPFGRGRADRLLGEPLDPVADILLVLAELQRERRLLSAAICLGGCCFLLGGRCFHGTKILSLVSSLCADATRE